MELPKSYNSREVEDKIYSFWEKTGFFNPDNLPKEHKKPYTIVIPPPNVTGELHMGHALNATIQDILIRWKRMQGYKTLWIPGTDHAGIATQNVVEKKLKKQGITRFDLGKDEFINEVWKWKEEKGNAILNQFKKIGCSCDWSRTRFTMDEKYKESVRQAFLHYHKKGLIYQGERVVNWCPRCSTSLSDLELEHKEEEGSLWYIKYGSITVATTRPETMLGDTAVAVNPKDKRYKGMIGKKVIVPIVNREVPVVADRLIDSEFGTGAIKVTPAHDQTDYEIGQKNKLESIKVIDEKGRMTNNVPKEYQGLKVLEAREKIVQELEEKGYLERVEDYTHQVPKCYRCNTTIELIPSLQWFLKMKGLAKMAEKAVKQGKIKIHPKNFEKPYLDWLSNIRDWCISRQIWWGHQLPVWHCQTGRISNFQFPISKQTQNSKFKTQNSSAQNFIVSNEKPKKCPFCKKCKMKQSADVLDTWFSSALWPFATLGWPASANATAGKARKKNDLDVFYPTDVLSTARDIINLWVARMIFSGMEFMKDIPFKDVYIHATILTKDGKRMSKSLGTGIDPLKLIDQYGADATRFGIAYQIMGNQDIRFADDNIVMGKKFCNKIWNATRFVLTRISSEIELKDIKASTSADKKILKQLDAIIKSVNKDLKGFKFGKVAHTLYDFFWHDFCDIYIEASKAQDDEETQKILMYVLSSSLKLLHPFVPFITEEIYQTLPIKNKKQSLMIESWPTV